MPGHSSLVLAVPAESLEQHEPPELRCQAGWLAEDVATGTCPLWVKSESCACFSVTEKRC